MDLPNDMSLWEWVKQRFTPLGSPKPYRLEQTSIALVPRSLDLHGFTVQAAYERCIEFIHANKVAGQKTCEIITGRSGQICQEFPEWMNGNAEVRAVQELRGGGAFKLYL